jgi:hypothetical protein
MTKIIEIIIKGTRTELRRQLIRKFLLEKPGTGKKELCSKYTYQVDNTADGKILLARPANLNKGMDFIVHLEGFVFRTHKSNGHKMPQAQQTNPSFKDVIALLHLFKKKYKDEYQILSQNISRIYECKDLIQIRKLEKMRINHEKANKSISARTLCLIIRWLFIEQDVTYWNFSGRGKFLAEMRDDGLLQRGA